MDRRDLLAKYARENLAKPEAASESAIESAASLADSIVGARKVGEAAWLDIAYFRLRALLKCEISEVDMELYNKAVSLVKSAPLEADDGAIVSHIARTAPRKNRWLA
jgi:hypothetical protein